MTPSAVEAAPAPTWTVHWVKPVEMVVLFTVAVHPLVAPATVAVLPLDSVVFVFAASAAKSAAQRAWSEKYASWAVIMLRRSVFTDASLALSFVAANFGMAMAARMPMITTTISSSIKVNQ